MKAMIIERPGQARVSESSSPKPGPHDVIVTVSATGVCAGDLYIYSGKNPYATYPIIAGHEIAGVIEEVGSEIRSHWSGQRVVVEPFIGCGECYPCRIKKSNCCTALSIIGVHRAGGFAEHVVAPATNVFPIPDSLSMSIASFAEPLAIGIQASRRAEIERGEVVLILGCGPIGLALIEVTLSLGGVPVVADLQESRLQLASELGAETVPAGQDPLSYVLERTNGEGAPVVIEATGVTDVMQSTVGLVASGGRIVIVGLVKKGMDIAFPGLDITRKEMTLLGSRASVGCFPKAIELLASGSIRYPGVATEFSLWDGPEVLSKISSDPLFCHKAVLIN